MLHVLEALEGGTARHLVDVVRHTTGVRHAVALPSRRAGYATDEEAAGALRAAGADVHVVEMRRSPFHPYNARAVVKVRQLTRALGAAVVHGHSSIGGALARVATWDLPVSRVYTPNGVQRAPLARSVERLLGRRTDRLIAVSSSEGELVARSRLVPADRLVVIANGIDVDQVEGEIADDGRNLRTSLGLDDRTPLVGTVARLLPQKAPVAFVRAAARVARTRPDVHVVLVGSGPLQHTVERAAAESATLADRFHHVPHLPRVAGVLGQLDVFVLLSRFEGGPYAPLEAMAAGTPVVLSDVVGNRDVVEDGVSGLLVPFGDHGAAADAITGLLADAARRDALARAARARVRCQFDVRRMGDALSEVYRGLTAR